jgi:hypothetical protein
MTIIFIIVLQWKNFEVMIGISKFVNFLVRVNYEDYLTNFSYKYEFFFLVTLTFNNQVIRLLSDLGNSHSAFKTFQTLGLQQWRVPEEQQLSIIDIALQKNAAYATAYVYK